MVFLAPLYQFKQWINFSRLDYWTQWTLTAIYLTAITRKFTSTRRSETAINFIMKHSHNAFGFTCHLFHPWKCTLLCAPVGGWIFLGIAMAWYYDIYDRYFFSTLKNILYNSILNCLTTCIKDIQNPPLEFRGGFIAMVKSHQCENIRNLVLALHLKAQHLWSHMYQNHVQYSISFSVYHHASRHHCHLHISHQYIEHMKGQVQNAVACYWCITSTWFCSVAKYHKL